MTEYAYDRRRQGSRRSYYEFPEEEEKTDMRKGNKVLPTASLLIVLAVLVGMVLFGFFSSYFNVKSISVTGLMGHTEDEIKAVLGIKESSKIFTVSAEKIRSNILAEFPAIDDVTVTKKLPSTVGIHLTYATPKYFISVTGEYFTLSESLKVLERKKSRGECEGMGLTYLELEGVKRAVTGSELELFRDGDFVKEILMAYEKSYFAGDADKLIIKSKFDISIVKTSKYLIKLGDFKDKELKLKMAEKVLMQDDYRDAEGVILDVSNVSETTVQISKTQKIE